MFCYQCQQTAFGTGCAEATMCGKSPDVCELQDQLLYAAEGAAIVARRLAALGKRSTRLEIFAEDALFSTMTNVNFDSDRLEGLIVDGIAAIAEGRAQLVQAGAGQDLFGPALLDVPVNWNALEAAATAASIPARKNRLGEDVVGLQELLTYGVKGMAAYHHHARVLGRVSQKVVDFMLEALEAVTTELAEIDKLLGLNLRCGEVALDVLALLDTANTSSMGNPVPTPVLMGHKKGKAILISGHDLKDLAALLEQTKGLGINVYTHGEMLPAHGYPELKKYPHLVGHYGGAWQDQGKDFSAFPGPIVMTTNCLMPSRPAYEDRLFTTGVVAGPRLKHIADQKFHAVIEAALLNPGFTDNSPEKTHLVGFGHNAVLGVADKVVEAVKTGALKRFVLIGGCDGAAPGRNYYSDLAAKVPNDWAVLTLGCGKYRVLGNTEGTIGGLPRLLDMGQCNDSFSAIKVAAALAEVFGCGVNDLPLSLVLSWYEQKAVTVLLALLHLGIKNIRIGPSLPAFVSPAILKVLVDTFNIMPIGEVDADIKAMTNAA